MSDINTCVISGEVVDNPRVGSTKNGKSIANVRIKSAKAFSDFKGKAYYDYFTVSVFGQKADSIAHTVKVGDRILVNGSVHVRSYEKKDGGTGVSVEVNTIDVTVISDVSAAAAALPKAAGRPAAVDDSDEDFPF